MRTGRVGALLPAAGRPEMLHERDRPVPTVVPARRRSRRASHRVDQQASGPSRVRSFSSAADSSRDTCICDTPI
ncbi:hypothetical protein GCM10022629_41490 [Amorphoplanes auranticolor]